MDKLEEMDEFLETYYLPSLNQEKIENINRPITSKEIESVIRNVPTSQQKQDNLSGKFYQTFKECQSFSTSSKI